MGSKRWAYCWVWLLFAPCSWAHAQLVGTVRDAENGDSLAFAYILNLHTHNGCFSGLNGRFSLAVDGPQDSIKISLLGYASQTVVAGKGMLDIALLPGGVSLADVLIRPTENPALRIMRNAIAHRDANDPLNFSHFSFDTYNKLIGTPLYPRSFPDSTRLKFHLFLSETVTHRLQIKPGKVQEKILSARLAGYPGKVVPFTASDLQDLSFYANYVGVFGQKFLSPVSPPGLHQYAFTLRDTLLSGEDSIFTIDFQPRQSNFDGFKGSIRIHSRHWAISTVDVDLVSNEGGLLIQEGKIRQIYQPIADSVWVPDELYTEIDTKPLSAGDVFRLHFSGYSNLSNAALGDAARGSFRPEDELIVADGAGVEDSTLREGRVLPLTVMDVTSYRKLDSIGRKVGLTKVVDQAWKLADGRLGIGVLDVLLDRIINQNRVEKTRLGIGLSTNEQLSQRGRVGGFIGWGLGDQQVKYGGELLITPFKDDKLYLGGSYAHDLVESGFRRLGMRPERSLYQNVYREFSVRRWYLRDMDDVMTRELWVGGRLPTDLGFRLGWRQETVAPRYDYAFGDSTVFQFAEAEALVRWAPGARYVQNGGRRLQTSNHAPVFFLRYTQGFQGHIGDFAYHAAAMSMTHRFAAFRGGKGLVIVHAGWNDRSLPRARMRVYRGNFAKGNFTDLGGAFNTMRYDEFAADMYGEAFLYLSPKLRWLHIGKRVQPQLSFSMAAAWGQLYQMGPSQTPRAMQAPSKIFLEPGISLTRILPTPKVDTMISSWIRGIGFGFYYRVGAYTLPTIKENFAFRLSLGGI